MITDPGKKNSLLVPVKTCLSSANGTNPKAADPFLLEKVHKSNIAKKNLEKGISENIYEGGE